MFVGSDIAGAHLYSLVGAGPPRTFIGQHLGPGAQSIEEGAAAAMGLVSGIVAAAGWGSTGVSADAAAGELTAAPPKRLTPGLNLPSRQFGKKVAQHASDFGLDATTAAGRSAFRARIESVTDGYTELRQGPFQGGRTDVLFYRKGSDLVLTTPSGEFITILTNGETNSWFRSANQLYL